jgi:hypothetical protein
MKLVHQCPSCLFSSSTEELPSEIDNSKGRKGPRNRIFGSLKEFAQFIFCDGDKNLTNRDYYTKFYTSKGIQPKIFNASKKYNIERKHKIKKRESFNRKCDVRKCESGSKIDEIKGECRGSFEKFSS